MNLPKRLWSEQGERIEEWLVDIGYKTSQIEWMFGELEIDLEL